VLVVVLSEDPIFFPTRQLLGGSVPIADHAVFVHEKGRGRDEFDHISQTLFQVQPADPVLDEAAHDLDEVRHFLVSVEAGLPRHAEQSEYMAT